FSSERFGKALLGGGVGHLRLVEAGFCASGGGRSRVEREDPGDLRIFFEQTHQVRAEKRGGPRDCHHAAPRRTRGKRRRARCGRVFQGALVAHFSAPKKSPPYHNASPF